MHILSFSSLVIQGCVCGEWKGNGGYSWKDIIKKTVRWPYNRAKEAFYMKKDPQDDWLMIDERKYSFFYSLIFLYYYIMQLYVTPR